MKDLTGIRNFCIIAHIDHGKSTLADRLIQRCGIISERDFQNQMLDTMDLEREKGITIKSNTVTLPYTSRDGRDMTFNLIDTPGHVDFSYEVSRALTACEGALLLIDASQGVEAQTLANLYLAMENDLTVIPVINKIDLISADIEKTMAEIEEDLGLDPDQAVCCSAKTGEGVDEVLEAIANLLPPPTGDDQKPLQALIFDAYYDPYRGAIMQVRVFNGILKSTEKMRLMYSEAVHKVEEVGLSKIVRQPQKVLTAGDVGYVIAGVKTVSEARVGDTITMDANPAESPLPGFLEAKPVVFSSIYPVDTNDYEDLVAALEKLKLNDASLTYSKDHSTALGFGFRSGFLGLLHLEIVQERLNREYGLSLVLTVPSVIYRVTMSTGQVIEVDNPSYYPDPSQVEKTEEPYIKAQIMTPERYMGAIMNLCMEKRGTNSRFNYLAKGRLEIIFDLPLAEILYDFYDRLKTITQGYASFDYELLDYRETDVVRLDILVNGEPVDALSQLVFRGSARARGLHACEKLQDTIPRQQFKIAIQGAIGGQIVSRTTINPFRKDVTARCYGGDITRKRKLLEKQKSGKKKMKIVGTVPIPQEAFLAVLQTKTED